MLALQDVARHKPALHLKGTSAYCARHAHHVSYATKKPIMPTVVVTGMLQPKLDTVHRSDHSLWNSHWPRHLGPKLLSSCLKKRSIWRLISLRWLRCLCNCSSIVDTSLNLTSPSLGFWVAELLWCMQLAQP